MSRNLNSWSFFTTSLYSSGFLIAYRRSIMSPLKGLHRFCISKYKVKMVELLSPKLRRKSVHLGSCTRERQWSKALKCEFPGRQRHLSWQKQCTWQATRVRLLEHHLFTECQCKTLNRLILEWKVRLVTYLPSVSPGSLKMSKKTTRKVSLAQIEIMKRLLRWKRNRKGR